MNESVTLVTGFRGIGDPRRCAWWIQKMGPFILKFADSESENTLSLIALNNVGTSNSPGGLRQIANLQLPTKWGEFRGIGFEREATDGSRRLETAIALMLGELSGSPPLLRIHSQCLTGDALGSLRCDCGEQLELSMNAIAQEGRGLLIYEQQEGRGIGLMQKLRAYSLQDAGFDTVEANHALGFAADCRNYELPTAILLELGILRVRLLTNNPQKSLALKKAGIKIVEHLPCDIRPNAHSKKYLQVKREKMGHTLTLDQRGGNPNAKLTPSETRDEKGGPLRTQKPSLK